MAARLHASDKNSDSVRKRIENHKFEDEEGDEYEASNFGGFADYFRRKKIKLQNLDAELRSSATDKPQIFRGVVAQVNGYTQPSLNDLHALIVTHGGGFLQYLDGKTAVTHIIASSLTPKKRVEFRRYRIVKPAWVVESVKAGRLLPWDNYRVVDEGPGQKVLGFDNGQVVSQTNDQQRGYMDQTRESWYTEQLKRRSSDSATNVAESPFNGNVPRTSQGVETDVTDLQETRDQDGSPDNASSLDTEEPQENAPPQYNNGAISSGFSTDLLDSDIFPEDLDQSIAQEEKSTSPSDPDPKSTETLAAVQPTEAAQLILSPDKGHSAEPDRNSDGDDADFPSTKGKPSYSGESPSPAKKAKLTAEEHNAVLLSDPRMWKSSVLNPNFLQQYYSESRLHHLSNWKANLKTEMQQLAKEKSSSQNARQKRKPGARRYILHVDFDSFFAAVSLKNAPHYIDKPVVVAHGSGSGSEIASCNYPARKFGIKNGMWMKKAQELCPELKVLPYDFKAYETASRNFYEAILETGGIVQSVSVDEALVDVSEHCIDAGGTDGKGVHEGSIWREQSHADKIGQGLRDNIKERTGCAVSVGIGANILLAKMALRKAKPAGQYHIKPEEVLDFIANLAVQDLPGVAYSIGGKLEEIGVRFVKDVRDLSKSRLVTVLGPKTGEKMYEYARGIDRTEVGEQVVRKSVSAEVNWGVRFETQIQAEEFVHNLCGELHRRLVDEKVRGRQLTMKVMRRAQDAPLDPPKHLGHGKCDVFNKSIVLGVATNDHDILSREALSILRGHSFSPGELRGLGVQMTKLEPMKEATVGLPDSSQKRLQFKSASTPRKSQPVNDPIVDEVESPRKPKNTESPASATPGLKARQDDPLAKPLNTLGTQFIIPSQVDPGVLAELPEDIRSKLIHPKQPSPVAEAPGHSVKAQRPSNSPTPPPRPPELLPTESQLDPETLAALPQDVKDEVLAAYRRQTSSKQYGQALLPQSPRKARSAMPSHKRPLATSSSLSSIASKKRGGGLFSRFSRPTKPDPNSTTLTQSNFISKPPTRDQSTATTIDPDIDFSKASIAPDFLEALPPEIRQEVLAHQKRVQLQRSSNLSLPTNTSHHKANRAAAAAAKENQYDLAAAGGPQRRLRLAARPSKPTFTTQRLTTSDDLRGVIRAWYAEFADDGPYDEDVEALGRYLKRVVEEERDLEKAVGVVRWMTWVVEDGADLDNPENSSREQLGEKQRDRAVARQRWSDALGVCKTAVQEAVRARGLGAVEF